jgi:NitT/TauT family transport system substrate-binding protein
MAWKNGKELSENRFPIYARKNCVGTGRSLGMLCKRTLVVLLVGILLLAVACRAPSSREEPSQVLRLGLSTFPGAGPLYVAQEKGLCDQYDLGLELSMSDDNSLQIAQLQAGEIDAYVDIGQMMVFLGPAKVDLVAFLVCDYSYGADGIVATKDIQSIQDIADRNLPFGANISDTGYFILMVLAHREGLGPEDFDLVQMESSAAAAAFVAGEVDVAGTYEPWLSQALDRPDSHLLVTTRDEPGLLSDVFLTSPEMIESKREELIAFGRCWYDALDYIDAHEEEAIEIMARNLGLSKDEMREQMSTIAWPKYDEGLSYLRDGRLLQLLEMSEDLYQEIGLLDEPVEDLEALIYVDIAEAIGSQ